MTEQPITIKSVETLATGSKVDKAKLELGEHLKAFIEGITDDEAEQREILRIAINDLSKVDATTAKNSCKQCYGRGFTGYNYKSKHFGLCPKCFK